MKRRHPDYPLQTVRVILVFENPRAIFRIREMGEALYPYFLGGSLGWHDFLASTARLFRHDPDYRIPVKADPDIVIRNIRESHAILVRDLGESGALKIGGMYGILYQSGDIESFAACMVGYIRDVVTQLKRGLDGFWVAHPDFVRIGIALVEAWKQQQADPSGTVLHDLVRALVPIESEHAPLLAFIDGPMSPASMSLIRTTCARSWPRSWASAPSSPMMTPRRSGTTSFRRCSTSRTGSEGTAAWRCPRSSSSDRSQSLSASWMISPRPNGAAGRCGPRSRTVASASNSSSRSWRKRWTSFEAVRRPPPSAPRCAGREAARWYPLAIDLLRTLMTDPDPPEFVTELLMPYTFPCVRDTI